MSYFDFILYPVAKDGRATLTEFAEGTNRLFVEYGALRVVDTWGSDVPPGQHTDFYRAVAANEGEVVCAGFVEWPNKAARDAAWAKLEDEPRMQGMTMPFDGKRMVYGGFETIVDETA